MPCNLKLETHLLKLKYLTNHQSTIRRIININQIRCCHHPTTISTKSRHRSDALLYMLLRTTWPGLISHEMQNHVAKQQHHLKLYSLSLPIIYKLVNPSIISDNGLVRVANISYPLRPHFISIFQCLSITDDNQSASRSRQHDIDSAIILQKSHFGTLIGSRC